MPRRQAAAVGMGVLGLLLLACAEWVASSAEPEVAAPIPASLPVEAVDESFRVVALEGTVESRGSNGRWEKVSVRDELRADDAIRTVRGSRVVLGIKDLGTLEIAQQSELTVKEISTTVAGIRLDQGRMSAKLAQGPGSLRIEDRSGGVIAEASNGKFVVMSTADGHMVVAATEGNVRVSVGASSVVVNPGEQSEVSGGRAPSAPHAIPPSFFVKVGRPSAAVQREMHTTLRGRTVPGAIVSVNGVSVAADPTGEFEANVRLQEGMNELVVEAEDAFGRSEQVKLPPIRVKTQVKKVETKLQWMGGGD